MILANKLRVGAYMHFKDVGQRPRLAFWESRC